MDIKQKKNKTVSPQYEVTGIQPGLIIFKNVQVDLSAVDDQQLGELFKQGCPYVTPVGNDASAEASV